MRKHAPTLSDITAVFPADTYVPQDFRNASNEGFSHTEILGSIEVPYIYELDYLPARFPVPTVTVDGSPRTIIPYSDGVMPAAGQVAISFTQPLIKYSSADDGAEDIQLNYTAIGTLPTSRFFNQLQKEVQASQAQINTKAAASHTHYIGEIDGLQDELDNLAGDISTRQGVNANLTAISGLSSTGLIARTGSGSVSARTITGTANEITVSNGNGVSGNPTLATGSNIPKLNAANTYTNVQVFSGGTGYTAREIYAAASSGDRILTSADCLIMCVPNTSDLNLTLVSVTTVPMGFTYILANTGTSAIYNVVISTPSGSQYINSVTAFGTSYTHSGNSLASIRLIKYDPNAWVLIR